MEQELIKHFTSYGILGVLGFVFIRYVIKVLDRQHEEYKKYHSELLETLILLKNKIVHNYLDEDSIIILTRARWRYFISEINKKSVVILVNNNIKLNSETIKNELNNFGDFIISQTSEIFKPKMNENDRKLLIELLRTNVKTTIEELQELLFENTEEYNKEQCFIYQNKIRNINAFLNKKLNDVLEIIDEVNL